MSSNGSGIQNIQLHILISRTRAINTKQFEAIFRTFTRSPYKKLKHFHYHS